MAFSDIKTFEMVRHDMELAYNEYLKTGKEDVLWTLAHQVLSNSLTVLNENEMEDEFIYVFPSDVLSNKTNVITRLLNTSVGRIQKVCTFPKEGTVWFITEFGEEYDDDSRTFEVWEIYNIAAALYKMTEPLAR